MTITAPLAWFVVGLVFFFAELFAPGFIVFFFGLGAWLTALLALLLPLSPTAQVAVFVPLSLVLLFALRRYLSAIFKGGQKEDGGDEPGGEAVGATAVVTVAVDPPREGRISYSGSSWRAMAAERLVVGQVVEIVGQQGLLMLVKPLTASKEEKSS